MEQKHYLVPEQQDGIEKTIEHSVNAQSVEDAEDWFIEAKEKLLDVNNWKRYATTVSAEFRLTDNHGKPLPRQARKGDHISIDVPGPGSAAGNGLDWVIIEAIAYDDYPDLDMETIGLRIRPCANPQKDGDNATAHFFSDSATSTIVAERRGKQLTTRYYGRNEKANTEGSLTDTVRNVAIATGAWLGMSDAQWTSLIKGLLA